MIKKKKVVSSCVDRLEYYRNAPLPLPEQGIKIQLPTVIACKVWELKGRGKAGIWRLIEVFYIFIVGIL